jgi:hypothetical protein
VQPIGFPDVIPHSFEPIPPHNNRKNDMQKLLMVLAVLSAAAFAASSAQAVPAAATSQAGNSDSQTILVADGCGRHYHRGRHGHCRHN